MVSESKHFSRQEATTRIFRPRPGAGSLATCPAGLAAPWLGWWGQRGWPRGMGLLLEELRKEHLLNCASCRTTRKGGMRRGYGDWRCWHHGSKHPGEASTGQPSPLGGHSLTGSLSCQGCSSSDQAGPHIHPTLAPAMLMERRMEKEDPFLQEPWLLGAPQQPISTAIPGGVGTCGVPCHGRLNGSSHGSSHAAAGWPEDMKFPKSARACAGLCPPYPPRTPGCRIPCAPC